MEPLERLSEAIIDILKNFSLEKRVLTSAALKEAISSHEDLISLIHPISERISNKPDAVKHPFEYPAPATLPGPESGISAGTESLEFLRGAFLKILESLGPVITGGYENQFRDLQKEIRDCKSLVSLSGLGEPISDMMSELIDEAVGRMAYSNEFLVELSKDLYKMEEQLCRYHDLNRETHQSGVQFHSELLSHTEDMHRTLNSGEALADIRHRITAKLSTISKAVEGKSQADEARLREADLKIAELESNLKAHNQEIVNMRERADSLEKEVLLDELTQISNRRAYELQIRENLRRYQRNGEHFSLILMDVDHFKKVNDEYGHKAGDKCLKEIAKLIKASLRRTDFLARYGGEELIAILHGSNVANAVKVAEKIRARIEHTRFCFQDRIIPITISLGVTEALPGDNNPELPFIRVDDAMYRAKRAGRNRVFEVLDPPIPKIAGSELPSLASGSVMS